QPEEHGRVFGQLQQNSPEVAERVLTEGGDLAHHLERALDLRIAGRKQAMPEEHHLLLQWALRVDHAPDPRRHRYVHLARLVKIRKGAKQQVLLQIRGLFGVEEFFQCGLVSLLQRCLKFIAGCPKASAPEQVPHEFELAELVHFFRTADSHGLASTSETISRVIYTCYGRALGRNCQRLGHDCYPLRGGRQQMCSHRQRDKFAFDFWTQQCQHSPWLVSCAACTALRPVTLG